MLLPMEGAFYADAVVRGTWLCYSVLYTPASETTFMVGAKCVRNGSLHLR